MEKKKSVNGAWSMQDSIVVYTAREITHGEAQLNRYDSSVCVTMPADAVMCDVNFQLEVYDGKSSITYDVSTTINEISIVKINSVYIDKVKKDTDKIVKATYNRQEKRPIVLFGFNGLAPVTEKGWVKLKNLVVSSTFSVYVTNDSQIFMDDLFVKAEPWDFEDQGLSNGYQTVMAEVLGAPKGQADNGAVISPETYGVFEVKGYKTTNRSLDTLLKWIGENYSLAAYMPIIQKQVQNMLTPFASMLSGINSRITSLQETASSTQGQVGDLSELNTADRSSLVRAINEVLGKVMSGNSGGGSSPSPSDPMMGGAPERREIYEGEAFLYPNGEAIVRIITNCDINQPAEEGSFYRGVREMRSYGGIFVTIPYPTFTPVVDDERFMAFASLLDANTNEMSFVCFGNTMGRCTLIIELRGRWKD